MNDSKIEEQIQAKGLNAPRVSVDAIRDLMARVQYHTEHIGTNTFTHAFLDGRFYLATGHSGCVSPANFDPEIGESIAKPKAIEAARNKLWELEGYALYRSQNA